MADEKAIYESGISPLKVGDVLQGGEDDFIQVLAPSEKTNKYWCIHLDGSGFMEFDRALMYKFGWRLVENAPTIAQLLEAANPHAQNALNTLREVVPGEYRSVTGMVDYAREAIEERDAIQTICVEAGVKGGAAHLMVQELANQVNDHRTAHQGACDLAEELTKDRDAAMKQAEGLRNENEGWLRVVNNATRMMGDAGFAEAPLEDMVEKVLERLFEPPCDVSSLESFDRIINMVQEHCAELDPAVVPAITARNIAKYVGIALARCTNMARQFDRLREHLPNCDDYTKLMDQAIEAIEFKRKLMTPTEPMVLIPTPHDDWDMMCCLMGLEPGATAGDIIAAWAERNPESAYQQGRADAYRDIAKGGE